MRKRPGSGPMRLGVFLSRQNRYSDAALPSRGPDWELLQTPEDPDSPTRSVARYEGRETGAMDDSLYVQVIIFIEVHLAYGYELSRMVPLTDGQFLFTYCTFYRSKGSSYGLRRVLDTSDTKSGCPRPEPHANAGKEPEIQLPSGKSIPALPTDLRPVDVEELRHRYHQRAYSSRTRQCPMHCQVGIHRIATSIMPPATTYRISVMLTSALAAKTS